MGSHGEKGYKALFVMKVRTNIIAKILETTSEEKKSEIRIGIEY